MNYPEVSPRFERSLGLWHIDEQMAFGGATIALAGAGGDGGRLAEMLAQAGVGEIRLADPDPFEIENCNRQAFCDDDSIGRNKAEVVAERIQRINPDLKVAVYNEGVKPDNIKRFVEGADVVIDETEYTLHALGVMIAREARQAGAYNVMAMNVGFAGTVTGFTPGGPTFESMLGIPEDMSLDEVVQQDVDLGRWLPYLPPYVDLKMFEKVASGQKSAPTVQVGVGMAASIATVETQLAIVKGLGNNRRAPVEFPTVRFMDAMTGESEFIHDPVASFERRLAEVVDQNAQGLVPQVSY